MKRDATTARNRRGFLKTAALAATALTIDWQTGRAAAPATNTVAPTASKPGLIDTNVTLLRSPFRRVRWDDTAELVGKLRSHGVTQAWAGSFEGLLNKDIAGVNLRLAEECRRHGSGLLLPFGSINPALPDWEEDLRRCHEQFNMAGIRLHPNYHGYKLDDSAFARLLKLAEERGLIVQIAVSVEDERTLHPLVQVPAVDTLPLLTVLKATLGLNLVLLNAFRTLRGEVLLRLVAAGRVHFEIATLEGVGGVANVLGQLPLPRLLFGSHAPFFYFESALLKLKESPLTDLQTMALQETTARRLVEGR